MACDKENGVGLFFWVVFWLFISAACLLVGVGVRDSSLRGAGFLCLKVSVSRCACRNALHGRVGLGCWH